MPKVKVAKIFSIYPVKNKLKIALFDSKFKKQPNSG